MKDQMKRAAIFASFVSLLVLGGFEIIDAAASDLKPDFYKKSCQLAEATVKNITWAAVSASPTLPAKLLRLHFHDCFVRGCDASILLDSIPNNTAEKAAPPNRNLGGYDVIDDIKLKLEEICPGVVSCADIIALSTRDAVSFQFKESMWPVLTGREDGRVSIGAEASTNLPSASANFTTLLTQFERFNLDVSDLVALSGGHTIGITHCIAISRRLHNFSGKNDTDPDIDPTYAATLKTICPLSANPLTPVDMDPQSATTFDSNYFTALKQRKGIFRSDAVLLTDDRSAKIVDTFENPKVFFAQFKLSMKKMGDIGVLTNGEGEIRKNCRVANAQNA